MDFAKIGLTTTLIDLEDKLTKLEDYIQDEDGKVMYDECMDKLFEIIKTLKEEK